MKHLRHILLSCIFFAFICSCNTIHKGIPYLYDFNCDVLSTDSCEISEIIFYANNKGRIIKNGKPIEIITKTKYYKYRYYVHNLRVKEIYCDSLKVDTLHSNMHFSLPLGTDSATMNIINSANTIITQWYVETDRENHDYIYLIQAPLYSTRKAFAFKICKYK